MALIREIDIKNIEAYQRCPRAYELGKTHKPKLSVSTAKAIVLKDIIFAMHKVYRAFESYETFSIQKRIKILWNNITTNGEINEKDFCKKVNKSGNTKEDKALTEIAEILQNYQIYEGTQPVIATSLNFSTKITDIEFYGTIDLIQNPAPGFYNVIFLSTSSQAPNPANVTRNSRYALAGIAASAGDIPGIPKDSQVQFFIYHLPAFTCYKRKTGLNQKGDLKANPSYPFFFEKNLLDNFQFELLLIAMNIQNRFFPMQANSVSCRICPFTGACPRFGTIELNASSEDVME